MLKTTLIFIGIVLCAFSYSQKKSFFDFKANNIDGKEIDFKSFKGKKILVVNVASECGNTPQYKDLETLYKNYKDSNLIILGFPCNDFSGQEPGTEKEIKAFCTKNYGVTFQMMSKISITGDKPHPIYKWLQNKSENGVKDEKVTWNFFKFMVNEDGSWGGSLPAKISPSNTIITDWIMDR